MPVADPDGEGLDDTLAKKVGPLPLGVWLLAIGGGIAVAVFVRRQAASSAEDPGTGISTDTAPGAGNLGADGLDTPTPTRPTTNDEWYQKALDTILGTHLGYSPTSVATALTKYLEGATLTTAEQAIVSMAIRLVGGPPIPPPLPDPGNPPPPTPNPPPPKPMPGTPGPPGRVSGLRASDIGRYAVEMTWTKTPGATGYDIYSVGGSGRQRIGSTSALKFKRNGLRKGTRYQFWVRARNARGAGPLSAALSVNTKR